MIHITTERRPASRDERAVIDGLLAYNVAVIGDPWEMPIGVFLRDDAGTVRGGIVGHIKWRWMYIAKLWIADELRGHGHGRALMAAAEQLAMEEECIGVTLSTFEYQARPFYEKLGYEVFGVLEGYPPGYRQFHLRKELPPRPDAR